MEVSMRKNYLDNIKWAVIILVLVNHVVSIFSSNGSIMTYNTTGIPAMDLIGYLIYPWFMLLLFVTAGMSARYSLLHRSTKKFRRERVQKLLIPFLTYMIFIGPFASELAFRVNDYKEAFSKLPFFVIYIIKFINGMGPSWFLLQLFLLSYVLLLIRKLDKKEKLFRLGEKCNVWMLLLLFLPVLGAAQVLNVAYTFRNALYLLLFLLGYYIFSVERVQELLKKTSVYFLSVGFLTGLIQAYLVWGMSYQKAVNHWIVMLYTWLMTLGVMGCARRWFNQDNRLIQYMNERSFGIYLFHYVPMVYIAYYLTMNFEFPALVNYILVFILSFAASIVIYEIFSRIPVVNVLFGLKKIRKEKIFQ
jgi:peptidoglycan/LPS O-acetylase OafA/YrhL